MKNIGHDSCTPVLGTGKLDNMQGKYVWCQNNTNSDECDGWHKVVGDKLEEVKLKESVQFTFIPFARVDLRDWLVYETDPDGRAYEDWADEDFQDWAEENGLL